uniref:Dipeptidyl peptidase 1 n=1 Tax=Schistosoma japonicum TaxID=6182 RepID=C1L8H3_SCHJA|nr:hypotherical protein [Schistosoma japonicum]
MFHYIIIYNLILVTLLYGEIHCDTPANCSYMDAIGHWIFHVSRYKTKCTKQLDVSQTFSMNVQYPNIVTDSYGNMGKWTLIYNQGFEITMNHRKWLVMFAYGPNNTYTCNKSMPMWTHDTLIRQWHCFTATKVNHSQRMIEYKSPVLQLDENQLYKVDTKFIKAINAKQNSWKATIYPEYSKYTIKEMRRRAGGWRSAFKRQNVQLPKKNLTSAMMLELLALPKEFDWVNRPEGLRSPVTPVRNQKTCGSCYAFASTAAIEARIRLASRFRLQPILSPQDIIDCSPYSEGCDGGFPYLVAGKHGEDFGFVEEKCNPYTGVKSGTCNRLLGCTRYYTTDYHYIGGYYGATNEGLMKLELVKNGPFPVGFEVYGDFLPYKFGVYSHTDFINNPPPFNPFELTNHAVLLVGYGIDNSSNFPFWKIKNSWGQYWGGEGYFRILRGFDECGVESIAIKFDVVL